MPFFCPLPPGTRIDPEKIEEDAGSRPYYVASRVRGRQLVLERNRFYPGPRKPHVGRIVFSVGTGREACGLAVEQNDADYCTGLPAFSPECPRVGRAVRHQQAGRPALLHRRVQHGGLRLQSRPACLRLAEPDPAQAGDQLGDRSSCARSGRGGSRRKTHRSDPPTCADASRAHLPARRGHPTQPGQGARAARESALQAHEARPVHGQHVVVSGARADFPVQPPAAVSTSR